MVFGGSSGIGDDRDDVDEIDLGEVAIVDTGSSDSLHTSPS